MNNQTYENLALFLENYYPNDKNLKVIDVGSRLRTKSKIEKLHTIFENFQYTGVDLVAGENVDIVLENPYKYPFKDNQIDLVVANNIFEHSEHFWQLFLELSRILKPNGLLYTITPSNGEYHRGPFDQDVLIDAFRFYPDAGKALQNWANKNDFKDLVMLESYVFKRRDSQWNDYVSIFLKDKKHIELYPNRIIDNFDHFYNGFVYGSKDIRNFEVKTEDQILLNRNLISKIKKFIGI